jgi:hypothetical protein
MELPMLTEDEWALVEPLLQNAMSDLQTYRAQHGVSLQVARERSFGEAARAKYREITGFDETNSDAIWHHRASLFGPPCKVCNQPLRTPRASICAECGAVVA